MMKCVVMNYVISDFFMFKQKTAYEMRISDWSSDVCSSDLEQVLEQAAEDHRIGKIGNEEFVEAQDAYFRCVLFGDELERIALIRIALATLVDVEHEAVEVRAMLACKRQRVEERIHQTGLAAADAAPRRSEEHTSALQSQLRITYAVF